MLENIFEKFLPIINKKKTEEEFGKRDYIGASDVVKCPRQWFLQKDNFQFDAKTLVKMYRGKIAEHLLVDVFNETNFKYETQKEFTHPKIEKIKCHIDFFFYAKNYKKIGICECKTTNGIPDEPYESWILQLYFQLGLTKLIYPDSEIKGAIFVIDLNSGDFKEFNGFSPNDSIFESLIEKAKNMLEIKSLENTWTETSLLCGYCPFKVDCPVHTKNTDEIDIPEDVLNLAKEYRNTQSEIRELQKKLDDKKAKLLAFTGENFKASSKDIVIKVAKVDTKIIDSKKLKAEMPEIFEQFSKTKSYIKLEIK